MLNLCSCVLSQECTEGMHASYFNLSRHVVVQTLVHYLPTHSGLSGTGLILSMINEPSSSQRQMWSQAETTCHQHFSNNILGPCKHSSHNHPHRHTYTHTCLRTYKPSVSAGLCFAYIFSIDFRAKCQCVPLCRASCFGFRAACLGAAAEPSVLVK